MLILNWKLQTAQDRNTSSFEKIKVNFPSDLGFYLCKA